MSYTAEPIGDRRFLVTLDADGRQFEVSVAQSESEVPELVEFFLNPPLAPPPAPPPPIIVNKADIWRRATDEEAEVIDGAIASQPVRLRNLFRDAAYLSEADELFPMLRAGFVQAFGEERAAQLLAPS